MRIGMMALALGLFAAPAWAQTPATIPAADLATVSARGVAIYAYDQAAWHTTDTLRAAKLPADAMRAIRGWVVEPVGAVLRVTYYGVENGVPYAVYIADFAGRAVQGGHVPPADARALTPLGLRMVAAHDAAARSGFGPCGTQPFNSVVLPPDAAGRVPVYLLTPVVEAGAYPVGGHYEVEVDAAGRVAAARAFSRSCLVVRQPKEAKQVVGLFVSHLLDPHPTEIHVYLSLLGRTPLFVGIGREVWEVSGSKVRKAVLGK